ncbi:hypothetical protein N7462_001029 [Penicillium macrosclerotiorum]|uniref:uncharacterized protein n=1 Tax=Penicillium macrosclerotiorum TaxID=303699 RepID=UPI002546C059|nr:uncharacterized protein N7462_001029 [Penicillium macrosclerotiorum]KAJ5699024.1 hypothetical protein N7462_001029 [Penicillium macrosclerotiorum]
MKVQSILFSLFVAASAAPSATASKSLEFSGSQLKGVINVLNSYGKGNIPAADQIINCTVTYTLSLSTGPPYTIDLATLDLSGCTYSSA